MLRRIKNPKDGEYVLLTKYSDRDVGDPWFLGFYAGYQIIYGTKKYFGNYSDGKLYPIGFNYCFRINNLKDIEKYLDSNERSDNER